MDATTINRPTSLRAHCPFARRGRGVAARIEHDGFRLVARKDGGRVRLYSRPGNDLTCRFTLIVAALAHLRSR